MTIGWSGLRCARDGNDIFLLVVLGCLLESFLGLLNLVGPAEDQENRLPQQEEGLRGSTAMSELGAVFEDVPGGWV